jgi:hypothetical protein
MARTALSPLAAACAALVLLGGMSAGLAQERVGVSSAVNPDATGAPPGQAARKLVIGQEVVFNERIATQAEGQTQLLFLDESSMTVGPNSDLTIDQFVYDPKTGGGKLAMSATKGLLRFVGGKLSKQDEAVTLRTNSATLAIRGGAFIVNMGADGRLTAIFIYGRGLTITGVNGVSQTVQRPGFEVVVAGRGAAPSAPAPASSAELNQLLAQLDGRSGSSGGAQTVPTEQTVASSGVSQTISGNFNASLQQATAQFQTVTAPTVNPTTVLTNTTVQSATSLSLNCAIQVTCTSQAQVVATTVSGQPVGGSNSVVLGGTTAPITPTTPPVTLVYAGRLKNTNGNGTARGFVAQGGTADIPYSGGTLSFPAGQPQNGVFNATFGNLGTISFPLVPGTNSFQGTSSQLGPVSGTSFLSPDNSSFYASLVPTNAPTERGFIFGGTAVNPSFYQPTGQTRILAFNVQPDAALQSAVPFIRNQAGGAFERLGVAVLHRLSRDDRVRRRLHCFPPPWAAGEPRDQRPGRQPAIGDRRDDRHGRSGAIDRAARLCRRHAGGVAALGVFAACGPAVRGRLDGRWRWQQLLRQQRDLRLCARPDAIQFDSARQRHHHQRCDPIDGKRGADYRRHDRLRFRAAGGADRRARRGRRQPDDANNHRQRGRAQLHQRAGPTLYCHGTDLDQHQQRHQ